MRIQSHLLLSTSVAFGLVLLTIGAFVERAMQETALEEALTRAMAVVEAAEATRDHVGALHEEGAIDLRHLVTSKQETSSAQSDYRNSPAFHAIPVIAGIAAAKGAGKGVGLDITVTADDARNPDYDPKRDTVGGAFRSRLLADLTAQVAQGGAEEIHRIDEANDTLVFQHAIVLSKNCMLCHGDPATSPSGDGLDLLGFRMENWRPGKVHGAYEVRTPLAPIRAAARSTALGVCGLGSLVGLLGLGALFLILRRAVALPIQRAIATLQGGEGDLRIRLDTSRQDEIGDLNRWCNRFLEQTQGLVQGIAQNAHAVLAAASELDSSSSALSEGASRTGAQSSQVAAAAEEMTVNIANVGGSSERIATTFRTVAAAVEEMTASITEVAKGAEAAASVAGAAETLTRQSSARIAELGNAANEIGRVVETIQDIAEQTNLLALNATIEAARAGEAGKGFSVVANEVKDLARQTAEATQDIRGRIERIQGSTKESIGAISAIDGVIAKVSKSSQGIAASVSEQRLATQEISKTLAENTQAIEVVSKSVVESATASLLITRGIAEVDELARSAASGAEESQVATRGLRDLAGGLQGLVGKFKF